MAMKQVIKEFEAAYELMMMMMVAGSRTFRGEHLHLLRYCCDTKEWNRGSFTATTLRALHMSEMVRVGGVNTLSCYSCSTGMMVTAEHW
jgi:hypothetical protein